MKDNLASATFQSSEVDYRSIVVLSTLLAVMLLAAIAGGAYMVIRDAIVKEHRLMNGIASMTQHVIEQTRSAEFDQRILLLDDLVKNSETIAYILIEEPNGVLFASAQAELRLENIPSLLDRSQSARILDLTPYHIHENLLTLTQLPDSSEPVFLRIGFDQDYLNQSIRSSWLGLSLLFLFLLLGGVILIRLIIQKLSEPINVMASTMQALLNNTPLYMLMVNGEGTIIGCSRTVLLALGDVSPTGKKLRELEASGQFCLADSEDSLLDVSLHHTECRISLLKEERAFLVSRFSVAEESGGKLSRQCLMMTDISSHKHLEEQVIQMQRMEVLARMSSGIAHDFNNVLTVILGFGDLLKMELKGDTRAEEHLTQIMLAAVRAKDISHGLLAFSRKQKIERKTFVFNELLARLQNMLAKLLGEHILLTIEMQPEPIKVHADWSKMEQVLMNLVTNARDAMPGSGVLKIRLDADAEYVYLDVIDTGMGMSEETRRQIFEPFYTTKASGRGTGLGMSVVYGIIEQHQGSIKVSRTGDRGSHLQVVLPRSYDAGEYNPSLSEPLLLEEFSGSEYILLAEDDAMVADFLCTCLSDLGYKVQTCSDGMEALTFFNLHRSEIDLIITDAVMPKLNGGELHQKVKAICPDMPVLFLSGHVKRTLLDVGLDPEAVEFLPKPVTRKSLVTKVRALLDRTAELNGLSLVKV